MGSHGLGPLTIRVGGEPVLRVLAGFSGGSGSYLSQSVTYVRPGGDVHLMHWGEESHSNPRDATYRDQRQVLGDMEFSRVLAFDREGRARVFTNDDEHIYIQREMNDFVREEWLAIPFPHGMEKPSGLDYEGGDSRLQLRIGYDHANLAVGTLTTRFAPDWQRDA